jgi:hypothetical protein
LAVPEQPYDDFLGLYHSLRTLCSDDPRELSRWQQTNPEQDQVLRDIHHLTHHVRMRDTFGGRRKIIDYVPPQFKEAWSGYLKRWSTFVDYCVDMKNGADDFFVFLPSEYANDVLPQGETRLHGRFASQIRQVNRNLTHWPTKAATFSRPQSSSLPAERTSIRNSPMNRQTALA